MAPTIADVPLGETSSSTATSESSSPVSRSSPSLPLPEIAIKDGHRQRFLRGIQRMASSPSLSKASRTRSSSAPYGARPNPSCATISPTVSLSQPSTGSVTPNSSQGHISSALGLKLQSMEDTEVPEAPRKTILASPAALTSSTAYLPDDVTVSRPRLRPKRHFSDLWATLPSEIRVMILSYLKPMELVRASRVSKEFYKFCFDGQLWESVDASEYYRVIPAESLAKILSFAGPFIKDLNVRGCLQIEHSKRTDALAAACKNLINASLEGCRNFQRPALHNLIRSNSRLTNLNLASMAAVTNSTCKIISQHCPLLETLNVSWCKYMDAKGVKMVVLGCPNLKDLRAGEIRGFGDIEVAKAIFETNNLQRLMLSGCDDLTDDTFRTMIQGLQPEHDFLTDIPIVPARKLRHLDLSRCSQLSNRSITVLSHLVPDLEGLLLNNCNELTDAALEPIVASTPRLTHLELEDLSELTNEFLSKHLAKAPCAAKLEHLSLSYCENVGDSGILPIVKNCLSLRNLEIDNTRISDLVLVEATAMMRSRVARASRHGQAPHMGLRLMVFDCNLVTWAGILEILSWNSEVRLSSEGKVICPTEIIGIKCYFGWQQTVNEHTKRVLRGDFAAAARLDRKWAEYMRAADEAGAFGAGTRRRRRRAREAQLTHAEEEEGGFGGFSRRRARTMAASCVIM
ncbi:RNI-like protein [Xylaria nigripes]|nr:RNI-like protein [Xylaria nigripes]